MGAARLLRANEADQVGYVLRLGRNTKRWLAPELDGEQPILDADHADVLPGDAKKQGGRVFDSDWKGFTVTIEHSVKVSMFGVCLNRERP